jgi:uncharacterized protein YkwD
MARARGCPPPRSLDPAFPWPRRGVRGAASVLAVLLAAAASAATASGGPVRETRSRAPLILEARLLWLAPAADQTGADDAVGLEVVDVLGGFAAGSVLAAGLSGDHDSTAVRNALAVADREGRTLQVVLRPGPRASWRIEDARVLRPQAAETSAPAPLVATDVPGTAMPAPEGGPRTRIGAAVSTPSYEQQVVDLVNQQRLANGNLPPLKQVDLLHSSSEGHSQNMANRDFFAHCDLDTGQSPWQRMTAAGYNWIAAAENIAAGYPTPQDVMNGWMNSSGHRGNILSTSRWEIGVGYFYGSPDAANVRRDTNSDCSADSANSGPYGAYWTQNFGKRYATYPVVIDREAHSTTSTSVSLYLYGAGWAQDMRFSNNGSTWSSWEPFNPNKTWTLPAGNGVRTVWAQVRNGATVFTSTDTIELDGDCPLTVLHDDVIQGNQTFESCEIHAGPALTVTGDVALRADRTVLRPGFSVSGGGTLTVGARP